MFRHYCLRVLYSTALYYGLLIQTRPFSKPLRSSCPRQTDSTKLHELRENSSRPHQYLFSTCTWTGTIWDVVILLLMIIHHHHHHHHHHRGHLRYHQHHHQGQLLYFIGTKLDGVYVCLHYSAIIVTEILKLITFCAKAGPISAPEEVSRFGDLSVPCWALPFLCFL